MEYVNLRPLPFKIPYKNYSKLKVHVKGFDEAETTAILKLLKIIGFSIGKGYDELDYLIVKSLKRI